MMNILIPLAGKERFFSEAESPFSKPLIEFNGKTMIQHVIDNLNSIQGDKQFIFVVNSKDCRKYHLDSVLNLITDYTCKIIKLDNETRGIACSAMMAIEYIDDDKPLIISNADQLFDIPLNEVISSFKNIDAGVITFKSVHPRWSYVRLDDNGFVIETAEKRPISKRAIAGFYYFRKGSDFIKSSSSMIMKDASVNGLYYLSPTLNEMILVNKKISIFEIEATAYHTFYTPQKIKEYESLTCGVVS